MGEPGTPQPGTFARVSVDAPDRAALESFVMTPADGALVVFEGVVRDHDHGVAVTALDYEAHPDAERFLAEACREVADATGLRVAVWHRVGELAIGDVALLAAVAAPHRAEAFAACARLVDRVKESTPIWKRQHVEGGATEWVGL
ncbi:molybdopterin synthase catalytic subunit [Protaetiibacter mangrovi]|uniref:Molybdenum cofactor biosynthesis protein MoaE n=1 Tax=Protaetiibacter mangrovi TaxID=2970926 RepID=A0ABT1ZED2_9MICO|nr:molybdenum cofactor biosynthesis protein MoaE [Protaetiibacter mangrovi]MCS0499063.1 molybdenum cofactor biosynthesis protein MoaE [Protaetiibacter mangrovi]TPX04529.1 molybdenum cofactor biosynthesis protein MoaE [Schumannella luteola]